MKNMIKYIVVLFAWLLTGCYEEDKIHVGEENEPFYTLPQGNHDYDQDIVSWFDRCGFYILYDFDEKDLYWNNEEWKQSGMLDYGLTGKLFGKKADPEYAGELLTLITKLFFDNYPEEFLMKGMPLKMLLCSELKTVENKFMMDETTGEYWYEDVLVDILTESGYDYIAITGGNSQIGNMSNSTKIELALQLNSPFLKRFGEKVLTSAPQEFFEVCDYDGVIRYGTTLFTYGYLNNSSNHKENTKEVNKQNDLLAYLALLGYPRSVLEETPGSTGDSNNPSLRGVFNPSRDVNGLVRKKYDILLKWIEELGVDTEGLQYPRLD